MTPNELSRKVIRYTSMNHTMNLRVGNLGRGAPKYSLKCLMALSLVLSACGHPTDTCPNLSSAHGLIGQSDYMSGQPNLSGVSALSLNGPLGSAATNGTVFYVTDTSNNRILGYSNIPTSVDDGIAGPANFALGQSDFAHNQPATSSTGLASPAKVSISSPDGMRLVVADGGNNRVLIWNTLPATNSPANVVIGQANATSHDINQGKPAPTASTLSNPTAAMIANGKLFVVDKGNSRVLIWNTVPSGDNAPADIVLGQANMTSSATGIDSNSTPRILAMNGPSDVWTDGFTALFVSDSGNNRVLFWNGIPAVNNAFPSFVIGQTAFGTGDPQTGAQRLRAPWGLSSDGSRLFVADAGNNRVLVYYGIQILQNGTAASSVFGQEDFLHSASNDSRQIGQSSLNPTRNTVSTPTGVLVTAAGGLFVSDSGNNRILKFDPSAGVNGTRVNLCDGK
jgi:hypothetical protein